MTYLALLGHCSSFLFMKVCCVQFCDTKLNIQRVQCGFAYDLPGVAARAPAVLWAAVSGDAPRSKQGPGHQARTPPQGLRIICM